MKADDAPREIELRAGERSVPLAGFAGLALVCAGGEAVATSCDRVVLAPGSVAVIHGPAQGTRVVGRVLLGRRPAAGAEIGVVPHPFASRRFFRLPLWRQGSSLVSQVHTDPSGRFVLPQLAPGGYRLELQLPGGRLDHGEPFTVPIPRRASGEPVQGLAGPLPARAAPGAPPAPQQPPVMDLGDIVLADGTRLVVSVIGPDGTPIANAQVGGMQGNGAKAVFFEAHTDARGEAVLSPIDAAQPLEVACLAPGFQRNNQRFESPPAVARCLLERLGALSGRIVNEDDKPVSGATVTVREAGRHSKTAEDGAFGIEGLGAGNYHLTMAAPGLRAAKLEVHLESQERRKLAPIRLEPAGSLKGTVVDGISREPVAGAELAVVDPAGGGETRSDETGAFRLAAGADGGLTLRVSAEGYPARTVAVAPADDAAEEPLAIELFPGGRVHATVWDEEQGTPCLGCEVSLHGAGDPATLITGADGQALSDLLAAGPFTAYLVHRETLGSVVRMSGGDTTRGGEVKPNTTTEVTFGEPKQTIEVFLSPAPGEDLALIADSADGRRPCRRSGDGGFLVPKASGERVSLTLTRQGSFSVVVGSLPGDFAESVLHLPLPQGSVRGTLLHAGSPEAGASLTIASPTGQTLAWVQTGPDGGFTVSNLAAGSYRLLQAGSPLQAFELPEGGAVDLGTPGAPATPY